MSYLYYGCNWVIRRETNYREIVDTAHSLGCRLFHIKPYGVSEEGYHHERFAIEVPSEAALSEFVKKVGNQYGLINWYLVSKHYFDKGVPFFDMKEGDYLLLWANWLDGMRNSGRWNEELTKKLNS